MKRKATIPMVIILVGISALTGCGPNRESLATQAAEKQTATAAMWTPTFTVTPSATLTPTADLRYYETAGEIPISYVPPMGWSQSLPVNSTLMGWYWQGKTMTCPLVFKMGKSDLALDPFIQETQSEIDKLFKDYSVLTRKPFETDAHVEATKIDASFTLSMGVDLKLYMAIYIFHQDGYYVSAVYDRPLDLDNSQDPIIDASMRTFRFDK